MGCGYSMPEGIRDEIIEQSRICEDNICEIKQVINYDTIKNIKLNDKGKI